MKITVLAGSPKGENSVTMQYVLFLKKQFPEHDFDIIQIASRIKQIERDKKIYSSIISSVKSSRLVIWAFPLYYMLVCSQYKRFIELIFENKSASAFKGRYSASLSTSIHFYDHTAHNYIRSVCEDLGMNVTGSFSARMDDLFRASERQRLSEFFRNATFSADNRLVSPAMSSPLPRSGFSYRPGKPSKKMKPFPGPSTLVITDSLDGNTGRMIARLADFTGRLEIASLADIGFKGGCMGCMKCGQNGVCVYDGIDGFTDFYRSRVMTADCLVFAGSMKDRYLSSLWKCFFDRSFFNNHRPSLSGKQLAWIISGPLSAEQNLQEMLFAYTEFQGANLAGFATDDCPSSAAIDSQLAALASRLSRFSESAYIAPPTFRKTAGLKIFRDEVYSGLRIVFKQDHRYYRQNGLYDFPNRSLLKRFAVFAGYWATSIPFVYRKMAEGMKDYMTRPYKKITG